MEWAWDEHGSCELSALHHLKVKFSEIIYPKFKAPWFGNPPLKVLPQISHLWDLWFRCTEATCLSLPCLLWNSFPHLGHCFSFGQFRTSSRITLAVWGSTSGRICLEKKINWIAKIKRENVSNSQIVPQNSRNVKEGQIILIMFCFGQLKVG